MHLTDRLAALEAALGIPAPSPGGPLTAGLSSDQKKAMAAMPGVTKSDFYTGGPAAKKKAKGGGSKGGGRHVASKAGVKRYGLPIGTPLGQTNSKTKGDAKTQVSYDTFQAAKTPADMRAAAKWMSNDDLLRAGEALFSFQSTNAHDEAARLTLVRELADRGIDPHSIGYKGGPVVLNPKPKPDPVAKAVTDAQKAKDAAQAKLDRAGKKAATQAQHDAKAKAVADKKAQVDAAHQAIEATRKQIGDRLARGEITDVQANDLYAEAVRKQSTGG